VSTKPDVFKVVAFEMICAGTGPFLIDKYATKLMSVSDHIIAHGDFAVAFTYHVAAWTVSDGRAKKNTAKTLHNNMDPVFCLFIMIPPH
jgi:hypothetical protein